MSSLRGTVYIYALLDFFAHHAKSGGLFYASSFYYRGRSFTPVYQQRDAVFAGIMPARGQVRPVVSAAAGEARAAGHGLVGQQEQFARTSFRWP